MEVEFATTGLPDHYISIVFSIDTDDRLDQYWRPPVTTSGSTTS